MTTARCVLKTLLPLLLFFLLSQCTPDHALAQEVINIQADQSARFVYGESLTFQVSTTAPAEIQGARLTVRITNRDNVYSEAVSISPATTVSASHTLTVAALQLPPFARITYFWDFQDAGNRLYRSDEQPLLYEDTHVPWKWERVTQGPITINTNGLDEIVASTALDIASRALAQQSQSLGLSTQHDISVYVYPDLAQLASSLRMHEQRVQDWVAAYAIPDQHVILIAAIGGPELVPNLERDLPHEISHVVTYDIAGKATPNVPGWFNEGLALASMAEPDPSLKKVLSEAVQDGVLLSLESLCANNFGSLPPRDAALAYAQSESIVRYIVDRYGTSQIQALMAAYADGLSCSGAVERALGISLTSLETQWHGDIGRSVASTPQADNMSLTPWIVAWIVSVVLALLFISPQPQSTDEESAYDTRVALSSVSDKPPDARMDKDRP